MSPSDRQRIFDKLMESVPEVSVIGQTARREMEEITACDVDAIEPIIDDMLLASFGAGKRFADRKTAEQIVNSRETVIVL